MRNSIHKHTNRLIHETSPYLLQHAHNPVDWHPWSPEALNLAKQLNKPIFLSIGYSTCYWCHVMERECFEDQTIAAQLNRLFVPIKIDREERPDLDQFYMLALQLLTHSAGWPMSVFLTPNLLPFYAGTYFPPTDVPGRPGFLTILHAVSSAFHDRPADIHDTTTQLMSILQEISRPKPPDQPLTINQTLIDSLIQRSTADYAPRHAGCGSAPPAPKFPRQTLLELLLTHSQPPLNNTPSSQSATGNPQSAIHRMVLHTLDALADGGIHDHLSGAFHRYATDDRWLIPHFEIMLYDNAMLAWLYAEAFRQTQVPRYARVARGICDFVLREMTSPQGAFYTAFDAETDAHEGLTYLWTNSEVQRILSHHPTTPQSHAPTLPNPFHLFAKAYGLDRQPTFDGKYILHLPKPLSQLAHELQLSEDQLDQLLSPLRQRLYHARQQRKQPALDTKIITSWNALMIRALAHAGRTLAEPRYTHAAHHAAQFLLTQHLAPDGALRHTSNQPHSFLDDYAFLIQALLEIDRHQEAQHLCHHMIDRFHAPGAAFFFTPDSAADIPLRQQFASDSPLPSGNAVAAQVLLKLGHTTLAQHTLSAFAPQLHSHPESASSLLHSASLYVQLLGPLTIDAHPKTGSVPSPLDNAANILTLSHNWVSPRQLHLQTTIVPGYHINSHHAPQGLISTNLTASIPVNSIDYPDSTGPYTGTFTLIVKFPTTPSSPITIRLAYQPCTDSACLPPTVKELHVPAP